MRSATLCPTWCYSYPWLSWCRSQHLPSGRSLCSQFRAKSRVCSVPRLAARDGWMAQWARLTVESRWEYWAFGPVVVGRSHPKRLGPRCRWMPARDHDRQTVVSRANRGARGRQMTHGCSEVGSHPAPPSRRNAATDKTLVMRHVERLVADGHATWRQRRGRALELTLATGEVFRLGKTTVTRIF